MHCVSTGGEPDDTGGEPDDTACLVKLIKKAEGLIERKIRYVVVDPAEAEEYLALYPEALLLWQCG